MRSLRVRGVPADNGARPDLMQVPAVRSLLAFLRVVADPSNNLELYALATAEPYRLTAQQLGPQLNGSRRRSRSLWDTLVAALEDPAAVDPATRGPLTLLIEHVRAGLEHSARHTTGEVLHDYLRRSGTLGRLARLTDDGPDLNGLRGIARFVGLIRGRASLLAHDRVAFLVPHLERLSEQETQIERDGPPDDQVAVLTVHRAKGLEFNVVYICGLVDGHFPVQSRTPLLESARRIDGQCGTGRQAGRRATPVLRCHDQGARRALAELPRWRAWYTPALAIHRRGGGRDDGHTPSAAHRRAIERGADRTGPAGATRARDFTAIDRWPAVAQLFTGGRVPDLSGALSTALRRWAVDAGPPRARLRQRAAPGDCGISRFAGPRRGTRRGRPAGRAGSSLAAGWLPVTRARRGALCRRAARALARFRQRELASGVVPVAIERPFRFRLGQDQIVGRVDRLDGGPDGVVITDYKSSDVSDQKRADNKARESLQLQVYAMAHQAETGELPARVQLHFIDTGVIGGAGPDGRASKRPARSWRPLPKAFARAPSRPARHQSAAATARSARSARQVPRDARLVGREPRRSTGQSDALRHWPSRRGSQSPPPCCCSIRRATRVSCWRAGCCSARRSRSLSHHCCGLALRDARPWDRLSRRLEASGSAGAVGRPRRDAAGGAAGERLLTPPLALFIVGMAVLIELTLWLRR